MRIKKQNIRSIKAVEKLPYALKANESRKYLYEQLNKHGEMYDLFEIPKDLYNLHVLRQDEDETQHLLEA